MKAPMTDENAVVAFVGSPTASPQPPLNIALLITISIYSGYLAACDTNYLPVTSLEVVYGHHRYP